MPSSLAIAIVGGGPAGLTAAVILQRGGYHVRVYESDPSAKHRAQGGTLDLHEDKGQVALQRAGLLDAFRAVARHEDQEERNVDPRSGCTIDSEPRPDDDLDRPEIDRGVLRSLLLKALPDEVVRWDHRLSRVELGGDRPHALIFEDGSRAEADIVVGADGAWSRVRPVLTDIQPAYTGVTFMEGWIESPSPQEAEWVGHGTLFSFGGAEAIFAQRNGEGRICVYAALKRSRAWLEDGIARNGAREVVTTSFEGWAANLRQLLNACSNFFERPIYSLPADFGWAPRAGITLIGDAAHVMPPVGLGVNLAMLDASDLAAALCADADAHAAIRHAEAVISKRAKGVMPDAIAGFQQWFSRQS